MSIKDNLRVIPCGMRSAATIKGLQSEQRKPTKDELEILKEFNGWGAMWKFSNPIIRKHSELKFWLTLEEFEAAHASILNARYTPPDSDFALLSCAPRLPTRSYLTMLAVALC